MEKHALEGVGKREKDEIPVLLMKLVASEVMPVDIGFLATSPDEQEVVYPPGAYLEQRREYNEMLGSSDDAEEGVPCKCVEVAPHVLRASGMGKGKRAGGAGGATAAVPGATTPAAPSEGKTATVTG